MKELYLTIKSEIYLWFNAFRARRRCRKIPEDYTELTYAFFDENEERSGNDAE